MTTMKELLAQRNGQAQRLVMQSAVMKRLKEIHDADRASMVEDMDRGDKVTARSGDQSLGTVSYSDPKPKARVTDKAALMGHVAGEAPEKIGLRVTDMDAALAVLEEHAPDLVEAALSPQVEAEYLRAAEKGESVPGVEVSVGKPVLSIRPAQAGKDAAAELVAGTPQLALSEGSDDEREQ